VRSFTSRNNRKTQNDKKGCKFSCSLFYALGFPATADPGTPDEPETKNQKQETPQTASSVTGSR
jgi:hypothetical protein